MVGEWRWPLTPSSNEVRIKIQLYFPICLHGMHTANTSSLYCFLKGRWNSRPVHNSNTRTLNLTGRIKITADGTRCRSSRVWPSLLDVNSRRGKVVDITNSLQYKNRKYTYCVYFTLYLVEDMEQLKEFSHSVRFVMATWYWWTPTDLRSVQTTQSCQKTQNSTLSLQDVKRIRILIHYQLMVSSFVKEPVFINCDISSARFSN